MLRLYPVMKIILFYLVFIFCVLKKKVKTHIKQNKMNTYINTTPSNIYTIFMFQYTCFINSTCWYIIITASLSKKDIWYIQSIYIISMTPHSQINKPFLIYMLLLQWWFACSILFIKVLCIWSIHFSIKRIKVSHFSVLL
mgnify:CR=1 FL=1